MAHPLDHSWGAERTFAFLSENDKKISRGALILDHATADPDRPAPGTLDARQGRPRAARLGYPLDMRRPRFGDALPETMRDHAGAVIFGGPMSANDDDEFIRREIDWIAVPLKEDKPFLGICLGAQMLARALGARVFPHPEGQAEIGYYPIRPTRPVSRWSATGRSRSISGTAKASSSRAAPSCWPKATCSRCRRSAPAAATRCNSIPT